MQDQYLAYIRAKSVKLREQFRGLDVVKNEEHRTKWRSELSIILLDYRESVHGRRSTSLLLWSAGKLREGIKSIRRVDIFSVEGEQRRTSHSRLLTGRAAYESSVRCSIEAHNFQQLASCLPHLVLELFPAFLALSPLASVEAGLSDLSLAPPTRSPPAQALVDRYTYFVSIYLLYLISTLNDLPAFHSTLTLILSTSTVSSSSPHLVLATRGYLALLSSNYVAWGRLLSPLPSDAPKMDAQQLVVLRTATERVREMAWRAIEKSYKVFSNVDWLREVLLFTQDEVGRAQVAEYLRLKGKLVEG